MRDIKFKTAMHGGIAPKDGRYQCRIVHNRIIGSDEIAEDMAATMRIDPIDAQLYISTVAAYVLKSIAAGNALNFGAFELSLSLRGTVQGANGAYPESEGGVCVNLRAGSRMKAALSQLKPVNASLESGCGPRINSVVDAENKAEGVISPGATVFVAGANLDTNPENADEGISLENLDGEEIARGTVLHSTSTTLDAVFAGPIPAGECRLVLRTRSGDARRANPAVARKRIRVAPARAFAAQDAPPQFSRPWP